MASSSASDVRRARAARFSISPIQNFGSPSFSLGLEKLPPPPTFVDEGPEKVSLQRSDEKQNFKWKRVLTDSSSPSFSLGLEDIPPTFEYGNERESPRRIGQGHASNQRQELETTEAGRISSSTGGQETVAPIKIDGHSGTDVPRSSGREHQFNHGRPSRGFSAPSFSLGLEGSYSPPKSDLLQSRREKRVLTQTRAFGDGSTHHSSSPCSRGFTSSPKSDLPQVPDEKQTRVLKSTSSSDLLNSRTTSQFDHPQERLRELKPKQIKLEDDVSPPSSSILSSSSSFFEDKIERTPNSDRSLKSSEEQAPGQIPRSVGTSPPPKLIGHVKTEPTSGSDLPHRVSEEEVHKKTRKTSAGLEKFRPTSRSERLSRSNEDQIPERRLTQDGPFSGFEEPHSEQKDEGSIPNGSQSVDGDQKFDKVLKRRRPSKAVDSTKAATKMNLSQLVGLTPKKEQHFESEDKIGEDFPSSFSHGFEKLRPPPPNFDGCALVDLSEERDENATADYLKGKQVLSAEFQTSQGSKIPIEDITDLKVKLDFVDISTPPSTAGRASNRLSRNSDGCLEASIVQVSEDEQEFERILKRRRLSKPCTQIKLEPTSTYHLEDSILPPVDSTTVADERTPGTPLVKQKRVFKRLRRGSSSAVNDSPVNKTPVDSIDGYAGLKKVKAEPGDSSFHPNNQAYPSADDAKKGVPDSFQHANTDDFDDIEDFSDNDLLCAGSRPQRERRSLQSQIVPKKLSLSTPSPAGVKKPVLHIPGLDTEESASVIAKNLATAKSEPITRLDSKISPPNVAKKTGNVKAEPITLSDDEELWPEISRSRVFCSQTLPTEDGKGSTTFTQNQKLVHNNGRAGSSSNVLERGSSWKGKSPIMDGSDLWKSYTENLAPDGNAGPSDGFAGASNNVYKMCQSEDGRIADLLRERLPHFKSVDALLLDGGLDQEPVYIDYRNQFGQSQRMDSVDFAQLDCSQPQTRRKQKRSSSKSTKSRKVYGSSATVSSQRTTVSKSPSKGKRKAWTLFREKKGRASASASTSSSGNGYWIVENKRRVYVKDGRTLTGRSAYSSYKKDIGNQSRKTKKKPASKAKR